eukprot:gene8032-8893_t
MWKKDFEQQASRINMYLFLLFLVIIHCSHGALDSGEELVQVKLKGTANFTWSFEPDADISLVQESNKMIIARRKQGEQLKQNPKLPEDLKTRISFRIDEKKRIFSFFLKEVTETDDGKKYKLLTETATKVLDKSVKKLTIVEEPHFTHVLTKISEHNEGGKVVLKCSATGKPAPKVVWINQVSGTQLSSALQTQSLTFEAINRTDADIPEIDVLKSSGVVYSYVGNPLAVKLKCVANGQPKPTYQWKNTQNSTVSFTEIFSVINPTESQLDVSYQCFAINIVGTSKPHSVMLKKLGKPGKISASIARKTARSVSIQWVLPLNKGGGDLTSVIIEVISPSGSKVSKFPINLTNTTFTALQPYTSYSFLMKVKNQLLKSAPFRLNAQTLEDAPSAPLSFRQGEHDSSLEKQITISWSPPLEKNGVIRNYEIAYGSYKTFDVDTADKKVVDKDILQLTLKELKPYHEYAIQVRAITISPGKWTQPISAMTANEAPSAPRNVSVEVLDAHRVRVTWNSPEFIYGPISTLQAKLSWKVHGKWLQRSELFVNNPEKRNRIIGNSLNDKLKAFTDHKIQIREAAGYERKWGTYSSEVFFTTPEGVPSMPKDMKVTHRTSNSLSLSWQMPSSINGVLTHFIVFYENSTKQYKMKINYDLTNQTFRHQITNLKESTKYTLMVQAFTLTGGGTRTVPLETSTIATHVAGPRNQPDDEISAGPIIGGIFSFLIILALLIILILFIARKQRLQKKAAIMSETQQSDPLSSPDARLIPPASDEAVPDVVTTNGNIRISNDNSIEEKLAEQRTFISSRPVSIAELKDVCDRHHANKDAGFIQEFKSIRREAEVTAEISERPENKCKNRYANILAYDHSRVILSYIENIPGSDYINANYVDGYNKKKKFIATQGPVAASFGDFWRMVWEQNSQVIVMVTNLIEKSRIKCQKYWPTGDAQQYGSITVTPEEEIDVADYVIRTFSVVMSTGKEKHSPRKVTQFQFTGWPDHGVPQYATALLHFVRRVRSTSEDNTAPIICHCSAGVGRTGTYITLDAMLDQIGNEEVVDIHGFLTHVRSQRNYMVQTEYQYAFIYDAILESAICGETEMHVRDLSARIQQLQLINPATNKSYLEDEFLRLSYNLEENHIYEAGLIPLNADKNRFSTVLPIESTRLKLWPYPNVEGSDYINANFVDGYQQREAFILTQAPLENTVDDFWRMIWEYEVYSIVMLTSSEETHSTHCYPYWPTGSKPATVGLLLVQIAAEEERNGFMKREFRVTNSKTGESRVVTHFMFYDWPRFTSPSDASLVIDLIAHLQRTQQMTGNASVAVHCSDGCGRSGSLCSIIFCIERLKLEGVVDIFQTVRLMRTQRPQIIGVLDHYLFCYNAVKKFVDKFSDYANFK